MTEKENTEPDATQPTADREVSAKDRKKLIEKADTGMRDADNRLPKGEV